MREPSSGVQRGDADDAPARLDAVPARLAWPVAPRPEEHRAVAVVADHGWSVVLVGAPGLGKSVLAARVIERVRDRPGERPIRVIPIAASPNDTTMPFASALAPFGDLPAGAITNELAAERSLREAADLVDRDVVLRIDDADQLDPLTARYIAWLVRFAGARAVITCRDFTTLPEPLRALWQDDLLERIDLEPLDLRATERLLHEALGAPLESASVDRVYRATEGNPLYLREVVRAATASGALEQTASGWYWRGRITASNSLADMYRSELAHLPGDLRDAVDIVALADPIPLSHLLAMVSEGDVDRVASLGLVTVDVETSTDGTPVVRPSHPLVGEVVRQLVPVARRSRLFAHANAFRVEPAENAPPAARLRSTLWALECGVVPPAAQLLDAAQVAVRLQEYDHARMLTTSALSSEATSTATSVAALCLRAIATTFSVGREAARSDAERAWALASVDPAAVGDDLVVESAEILANLLQFHDDDVDAALTVVDHAATMVGADTAERLRILRLSHLGWAGRAGAVLAETERAGVVQAATIPFSFLPLAACAAVALAFTGRFADALTVCRASGEVAAAHLEDAPWALGEIASVEHQIRMWAGDVADLSTRVARRPSPFFKYDFTLELIGAGNLALVEQRWQDAIRAFRAACERFAVMDHGGFAALAWARLALAQALGDEPAAASESLARAVTTPLRGMRVIGEEVQLSIAYTEATLGRPTVTTRIDEIIERAEASGNRIALVSALNLLFLLQVDAGQSGRATANRLRTAAHGIDAPLPRAIVRHADALLAGDERRMAAARAELAALGLPLGPGRVLPPLTRREHEVATLCASGLSNRQIAAQLGLSVRTVDAHVARIFAKWDIHSRTELADKL